MMKVKTASQPFAYEQVLISIVRTLPVERIVQILDYARPDLQRKATKRIAYGEQILSQVVCVSSALAKLSQSIRCESERASRFGSS